MRGTALLITMLALGLAAPGAAVAASPSTNSSSPASAAFTGGAEAEADTPAAPATTDEVVVPGREAVRLPSGLAAAPADAPVAAQQAIFAANEIIGKPYRYGGGHNVSFKDSGYDCSGTISYALRGGDLLDAPLPSGALMTWGRRGKGKWISVYAHSGHAYAVIAGLRLDTSSAGEAVSSGKGPRWRTTARRQAGFVVRHPRGL